jgi:oligopeptidase B
MKTKEKEIKKEQEVLGGKFDKNNYIEERVWATATDGSANFYGLQKIKKKDGKTHCCFMRSYGVTMDTYFHRHVCLF